MTELVFIGFQANPDVRLRIKRVFRELSRSEVGRRFLSRMPPVITFRYSKGDITSRASADPIFHIIHVPQNAFRSDFSTYQTLFHELSHLLQKSQQLDSGIKGYLEGAFRRLSEHQHDRRFSYVAEPLKRITTEETLAQDIVGLLFKLGYGRPYHNDYYIPSDEAPPPKGALHPVLAPSERQSFDAVVRKMQATSLPPEVLLANWLAFEEFERRLREVGWAGSNPGFTAQLAAERRAREAAVSRR